MSEPVTERIRLKLRPGHGTSFGEVSAELAAIMEKEPGTWGVYWGLYEEDKDAVDILVFWDSLESHDAVAADAEKLAPIYAALDPHLAAPPLIHNVALEPFGLKTLLQGNTMQMVTVEGVSVGVKRGEVGAIVAALNGCPTCRGVEVGETVGDDATKTSILAAGWQGPVSEEDQVKRGAEWWMNEAAKLGPEAKVEMHEVKFMKCYYRA